MLEWRGKIHRKKHSNFQLSQRNFWKKARVFVPGKNSFIFADSSSNLPLECNNGRHDIQHNNNHNKDIWHYDTWSNHIQFNDTQNNNIQHKETQHNGLICDTQYKHHLA
jgi:hypothetical protein